MNKTIFTCLERTEVYCCKWFTLFRYRVLLPQGSIIPAQHVLHFERPAVSVIVEDAEQRILFVKVYRYSTNTHQWEIPAGGVDDGEDICVAAAREVREESGYTVHSVRKLFDYHPLNGISNMTYHITRATLDAAVSQQDFDTSEVSEQCWLTRAEIEEQIKRNEIKCGMTLTALLHYLRAS